MAITPQKKYLYIPIEIYKRELSGVLLFSLFAINRGWSVVFGGQKNLIPLLSMMPEGVLLLKSITAGELSLHKAYAKAGHSITSIDAEGLITSSGKSGIEVRYSQETIDHSTLLFFWGEDQFNKAKEVFPSIQGKGVVTGSPIFDYWRYNKFTNLSLKKNVNKVILIATSFVYPNHFIGISLAHKSVKDISHLNADEDYFNEIGLDSKLQEYILPKFFLYAEEVIQKNPNTKIILRPHPSENSKIWRELSSKYSNVVLDMESEISKQLIYCDILIHFNSTTSIEAHYYGKTVLTYIPEDLPVNLRERINKHVIAASKVSETIKEALHDVSRSLQGKSFESNFDLNTIIKDSDSKEVLRSSSNIILEIEKICIEAHSRVFPFWMKTHFNYKILILASKRRTVWVLGWIDHWTNLFSGKYIHSKDRYRYGKTKQGKLNKRDVLKMVENFRDNPDVKNLNIKIKTVKSGVFLIDKIT